MTLHELEETEINVPSALNVEGYVIKVTTAPNNYLTVTATCPACGQTFERTNILHDQLHHAIVHVMDITHLHTGEHK